MKINNIDVFLTVARMQSISKAAKILFISQSTVSYRLKLLEDELDCKLIERGRGHNQCLLTREGEAFFPIAERMKRIGHEIETFKELSGQQSIVVGCVESMALYLFDGLMNHLVRRLDREKLHFFINNNETLYSKMESGQIDIAYVVEVHQYRNIISEPYFREPMMLVASKGLQFEGTTVHPKQLDIRDACQFDWSEQGLSRWFEHWFNQRDLPYMKTNSPPMAYSFIKNHRCWAIVPYSMGSRLVEEADCTLYRLAEPPQDRICYRIQFKHRRPASKNAMERWNMQTEEYLRSKEWITMEERQPIEEEER